jgi:hypothetical protein
MDQETREARDLVHVRGSVVVQITGALQARKVLEKYTDTPMNCSEVTADIS